VVTIRCGNRQFTQIQAIIFDKDGTLEDSQQYLRELGIRRARILDAQIPGIGEPLLMSFGIHNNTLDPTGLMAVGSRKENEIAAAAYIAETGRSWFESLEIAQKAFLEADKYLQKNAGTSPLFTGCLEVIKLLFEQGLKLGILSAATTEKVENFVNYHQLSDYIQLKMGSDLGLMKPDPALFLKACEILGVDPQFTLMVGDAQWDIEMAKKAGAAGAIGICWGKAESAYLENADVIISQLDEIMI
jgi:phosphoglycolate phosphatase